MSDGMVAFIAVAFIIVSLAAVTIACIAILSASPVPGRAKRDDLDRHDSNETGISSDEIIDLHAALDRVASLRAIVDASERSTPTVNN